MPLRNPLEGAGELCLLDAATLANAYRDRSLSPVEVAKATLARAATINADFNAFTFLDAKGALTAAEASAKRWAAGEPLSHVDGVPTTLKDIVWVEGWSVVWQCHHTPAALCRRCALSVPFPPAERRHAAESLSSRPRCRVFEGR